MPFVSNARMYAVSPDAETAWKDLIAHVAEDAGTAFEYVTYPAPQPLEHLWRRDDLGCVQMCGYPIALDLADVVPLASPIPAASWAGGNALSRTDLIVRDDAPFRMLPDTFDGTVGWTVAHSQSGFNALRYHLLSYRSEDRPRLYLHSVGNLVTARRILDSVVDGSIDIGPLDAYWHMLVKKYLPELTENVRILESTDTVPMPAFVTSPAMPQNTVDRLREAFAAAHTRPWFAPFGASLLIDGFEPVTRGAYFRTLEWARAAEAAGYLEPG
ncbi:MAG: PhnD/SsuA/transferrin family substrate-binding protein [candidate division Zixibacteria bacterium]|nr:PhnD/SsuA/transferrin family substrate-binding protein [candidate division Zixibacteria bacterium]